MVLAKRRGWEAMRALLITLLLLLPASVAAQSDDAGTTNTDGSGDVGVTGPDGQPVGTLPAGAADRVDIVAFGIAEETEDHITFFIQTAEMSQQSQLPVPFLDPDFEYHFKFNGKAFRVLANMAGDNPGNQAFDRVGVTVRLQEEGGRNFRTVALGEATIDDSTNTLFASVPRGPIVDWDQAPLARGSTLEEMYVFAGTLNGGFGMTVPNPAGGSLVDMSGIGMQDRAPDRDFGNPYTLVTGEVLQAGDLFASTPDPVRWTNGEATTFVYTVTLHNRGANDDTVSVAVADAPGNWDLAFSDQIKVPAGQSANATLLVTIPFGHQHGVLQQFRMDFTGGHGRATASLGVYWPEIPQPAGHHDTIWFHSRPADRDPPFDTLFPGIWTWMNAAEPSVDTEDEGVPVPAFTVPSGTFAAFTQDTDGFAFWSFPLSPALRMGMDFDLSRMGEFRTSIDFPVPVQEATIDAFLQWEPQRQDGRGFGGNGDDERRESIVLARGTVEGGMMQGTQTVLMDLTPTEEADSIPYDPEMNLEFIIVVSGTVLAPFGQNDATNPILDPAATTMRLPLFEYHDPVDLSFVTSSALDLKIADGGQERRVNPGRSVVYDFEITLDADRPGRFTVDVSGTNAQWATVLGSPSFWLAPDEPRIVAVQVAAPQDAANGDAADITVTVTSDENAAVKAGVRTLTTVTTAMDIPDEAARSEALNDQLIEQQDAPGVGILGMLALLGGLFVARRRRL